MKRLLPLALLALTYAAYVRASDPRYEQKIAALMKKAQADRKAKGLDGNARKLLAAYPTPEMSFAAIEACPGATVPLKIPGKYPEGTGFVVQSDDVDVGAEKSTATTYEAQLTVKPTATPHTVTVLAISPVSGAQRSIVALNVGCRQTWTIALDSGETLVAHTTWPKGGGNAASGEGEWTRGPKSLDKPMFQVAGSAGTFIFTRLPNQAETLERVQGMQAALNSPKAKDLNARQAVVTAKLQACMKLQNDQKKLVECVDPVQRELADLQKEQQVMLTSGGAGPRAGCDQLTVNASGGTLVGDADHCTDGKPHHLTGTMKGEP